MEPIQKCTPTVVPAESFLAEEDAKCLMGAIKNGDVEVIIGLLTHRSLQQRLRITEEFEQTYNKNLKSEIKNALIGNVEKVILGLLTPRYEFYAQELYEAMKGLGTNEDTLIEILCSLDTSEIKWVKEMYQNKYDTTLEKDIKGDTSGDFKKLLLALCAAQRDDSTDEDVDSAKLDAQSLYKAGEERKGTEETTFNRILCCSSYAQLMLIFDEYQILTGHIIEKAIEKEFSGDTKNAYLAVIQCVRDKTEFFTQQLYKSMKGLGTSDGKLIRLLVTRCEIDLGDIKKEYGTRYSESLADAIKGDTSGDYRTCLLALIGEAF